MVTSTRGKPSPSFQIKTVTYLDQIEVNSTLSTEGNFLLSHKTSKRVKVHTPPDKVGFESLSIAI